MTDQTTSSTGGSMFMTEGGSFHEQAECHAVESGGISALRFPLSSCDKDDLMQTIHSLTACLLSSSPPPLDCQPKDDFLEVRLPESSRVGPCQQYLSTGVNGQADSHGVAESFIQMTRGLFCTLRFWLRWGNHWIAFLYQSRCFRMTVNRA